jgi:hypothetical protein
LNEFRYKILNAHRQHGAELGECDNSSAVLALPEIPDMPADGSNTNTSGAAENSLGRPNFVALCGQDSAERQEMLARILAKIDEEKLEVIRVAIVDTHGIVRIRPIEARLFSQAARNGVAFTTALFAMDSANNIFQNVFSHDGGCERNIEMTPLCKIEVTHPRVLGSREVRRGGGVDEQAGVQPS